jgi:hypothetical protein
MSNGIDGKGAEVWPKVQHGLHSFESVMSAISPTTPEKELADNLFELLTWVLVYNGLAFCMLTWTYFPVGNLRSRQAHAQS